jgi:hypothetical protein
MKLCASVPVPTFNVSVSDLYMSMVGLPILLQENMWSDINRSQKHECLNWD